MWYHFVIQFCRYIVRLEVNWSKFRHHSPHERVGPHQQQVWVHEQQVKAKTHLSRLRRPLWYSISVVWSRKTSTSKLLWRNERYAKKWRQIFFFFNFQHSHIFTFLLPFSIWVYFIIFSSLLLFICIYMSYICDYSLIFNTVPVVKYWWILIRIIYTSPTLNLGFYDTMRMSSNGSPHMKTAWEKTILLLLTCQALVLSNTSLCSLQIQSKCFFVSIVVFDCQIWTKIVS